VDTERSLKYLAGATTRLFKTTDTIYSQSKLGPGTKISYLFQVGSDLFLNQSKINGVNIRCYRGVSLLHHQLHFFAESASQGTLVRKTFLRRMSSLLVTANDVPFSLDCFHPEDGGDTFLRNVVSNMTHKAPLPRRRHSSYSKMFLIY
jgi:hypothetical protein